MRDTKRVSVWPVGLSGGLKYEGPICEHGKVVDWYAMWDRERTFMIDMAGKEFIKNTHSCGSTVYKLIKLYLHT